MKIDAANLMDITQSNSSIQNKDGKSVLIENIQTKETDKNSGKTYSVKNVTYEKPFSEEKKSADELAEEMEMTDPEVTKNQMVVLSNTTSVKDYKKMQEDGYSVNNTEVPGIVTEMDKIKIQLAKAGVDISIFGDDLSSEEIEAATGSTIAANQITSALKNADLPQTEDNVVETQEALSIADTLETPTDGTIKYMLDNQLEPTIENLYKAQYSTVGTYTQPEETVDVTQFGDQIEKVLEDNGFEVTDENIKDSQWLIENDIPLTKENLERYQELKDLELPTDSKEVLKAVVDAISEGKRPKDAILTISARRQLEEVRLEMSAKANYAHIGEELSIDTKAIEQTVEELKQAEDAYYKNILEQGGVKASEENITAYREIEQAVEEIKTVPAYTLGIPEGTPETITDIQKEGKKLQDTFEKANESYEALMTTPRKDMGDSIQKAFQNVNDILLDYQLEPTKVNQRAVRILAYNNQEITPESILNIKAVDEEVQQTFKNMTPKVVREMIKTGVNPLDMNINELNEKVIEIKEELNIDDEEEKFSKYLYKLEQNSEIAEEERSSYIGIYRLIAQVEKTDGAAIGMLAEQGAKMTMRNLITAVRSSKKEGREYTVDDDFGSLENIETNGTSITSQIEAAYQKNCLHDVVREITPEKLTQISNWEALTPEQLKTAMEQISQDNTLDEAYTKEQLAEYQSCAVASEAVYQMLEQYDLPKTVNSIIALQDMMTNRNKTFRRLFKQSEQSEDTEIKDLQQQVLKEFAEALKTPEDMAKAQQKLAETAENVMKSMINEVDVSSIDLKEMRLTKTQIELGTKMTKEETYQIPVLVGDSVTGVSLKIVRGKEEKGRVDVVFGGDNIGQAAAQISVKGEKIEGYIISDSQSTLEAFQKEQESFETMLTHGSEQEVSLHYIQAKEPQSVQRIQTTEKADSTEKSEVQTKTLYHMAESFIKTLQNLSL